MRYPCWLRLASLVLACIVFSSPLAAVAQALNTVVNAATDAEADAQKDVSKTRWLAGGCCFGPIAIGAAHVIEAAPPATRLLGKSPRYVASYTDAYRAKMKSLRVNQSMKGCLVGVVLHAVVAVIRRAD